MERLDLTNFLDGGQPTLTKFCSSISCFVRTWGYFGQSLFYPRLFCLNLELLRTKSFLPQPVLSEPSTTSDKV